jgi:hypothetical protein
MLNKNLYNSNLATVTKVFSMIIFQGRLAKMQVKAMKYSIMLLAIISANFNTLMQKIIQVIQ